MEWQENKIRIDSITYTFFNISCNYRLIERNEQFLFGISSVNGLEPTKPISWIEWWSIALSPILNGLYRSMIYCESSNINHNTYDSAARMHLEVKIPNSISVGLHKWGFRVIAKWGLLIERTKAEVGRSCQIIAMGNWSSWKVRTSLPNTASTMSADDLTERPFPGYGDGEPHQNVMSPAKKYG